jgi:competence protein ComEC
VSGRDRADAPRPSIPFSLWAALAFAGGAAAVFIACLARPALAGVVGWWPMASLGSAGAAASFGLRDVAGSRRGHRCPIVCVILVLACCVLAGTGVALAVCASWVRASATLKRTPFYQGTVSIDAEPLQDQRGWSVSGRLLQTPSGPARVLLRSSAVRPPSAGAVVRVRARLTPAAADSAGVLSLLAGVAGSANVLTADAPVPRNPSAADLVLGWRRRLRVALTSQGPGGEGRALLALWTGVADASTGTSRAAAELMRSAGVPWLGGCGAVQLSLVAFLIGFLVRIPLRPGRVRRWAGLAGMLAGAWGFCALGGGKASLVRGAIAVSAAAAATVSGRRHHSLAALAAAIIAIVFLDPAASVELALWLPVAAVCGAVLMGPLFGVWLADIVPRALAEHIARPLGVGLAATAATAPIAAAAFGQLAPLGAVSAVVLAPLSAVSLFIIVATAPLTALGGRMTALVVAIAAVPADLCARTAHVVAAGPLGAAPVEASWVWALIPAACIALWALWPRARRKATARLAAFATCAALVALSWAPTPPGPTCELRVMDVGQGDAILIRDHGHAALVDAAPDPATLRRALSRAAVSRLETVMITHAHADHDGGLAAVGASLGSPVVHTGPGQGAIRAPPGGGATLHDLQRGAELRVGRVTLRVLGPTAEYSSRAPNENDRSVVILLEAPSGRRVLLLGDAEQDAQQIIATDGSCPEVDVVKAAHHGSPNGWCAQLMSSARPRCALISVGVGNSYGHPSAKVVADYEAMGAKVLRTDQDGDLSVDLDTGRITSSKRGVSLSASDPTAARTSGPSDPPRLYATIRTTTDRRRTSERCDHTGRLCGPQAGLSHMGQRGRLARPCRGPPALTTRASRRPRLQP